MEIRAPKIVGGKAVETFGSRQVANTRLSLVRQHFPELVSGQTVACNRGVALYMTFSVPTNAELVAR